MNKTTTSRHVISLPGRVLMVIGLLAQSSLLIPLWEHTSTGADFLGRYSLRYGAVLILSVLITAGWVGIIVFYRRSAALVTRLPEKGLFALMIVTGLAGLILWHLSFETAALHYLSVNWFFAVAIPAFLRPDRTISFTAWPFLAFLLAVVLLIPLGITAVTQDRFSPDEAHWADMATTYFMEGGIYSRTWLQRPYTIYPGLPWSVVAYGWLLTHVDFAIHTGRIWNFAAYLVAFAGMGATAHQLYGRKAALLSVVVAIFSQVSIPFLDYRPDHQLAAVGPLLLFAVLKARSASTNLRALPWHIGAGLLATLSLNVHAAGIVFAVGLSIFYLGEFALGGWRKGSAAFLPLLGFGAGALIGTGCYYLWNIQGVGGMEVYLQTLVSTRWAKNRRLALLAFPRLEQMLMLACWGYLLWRRSSADRLYLGLLVSVAAGALLVDTQGYTTPFQSLALIPIGSFLLDAFGSVNVPRGANLRSLLVSSAVITVLFAQSMGGFVHWGDVSRWIRTGDRTPTVYEELRPVLAPYVTDDDILVSATGLIWTFPDHPHLLNFGVESTGQERLGVSDPLAVWETVQPTVMIYVQHEMYMPDALQAYLDREGFQTCLETTVRQRAVMVYRRECPETAR